MIVSSFAQDRRGPGGAGRLVCALAVLLWAIGPVLAAGRHAALVIDANTGRTLHAAADEEPRFPASLTKMMTLYIVFELMEQGRLKAGSVIKISEEAAGTPPSRLGLEAGSEIELLDAIKAIITKSANDISVAVAEHIAGSEPKFAALMTKKARELGMTQTTFRNAHGLPDPEQVTTARDMVTLTLRLYDDFPKHSKLFAMRAFAYNGTIMRNHNTLLGTFEGAEGVKTGYTLASGFNLVAAVRRDEKHVIGVIFGGASAASRNAQMRVLLTRALAKASTERTRQPVRIARAARPTKVAEGAAKSAWPAAVTKAASAGAPKLVEPIRPASPPTGSASPLAASVASPSVPIEIARVRPVVVAPRPRAPVAPAAPPPANGASEDRDTSTPALAAAAVGKPIPADAKATRPAAGPQPVPLVRAGIGAPPSTLQAQAERLRGPDPRLTAVVSPSAPVMPAAAAVAPAPGAHAIQIGAFASETEAKRRLQSAVTLTSGLLGQAKPYTEPIAAGGRQLYRARFAGFDSAAAANACTELRRLQFDCLVTKTR